MPWACREFGGKPEYGLIGFSKGLKFENNFLTYKVKDGAEKEPVLGFWEYLDQLWSYGEEKIPLDWGVAKAWSLLLALSSLGQILPKNLF